MGVIVRQKKKGINEPWWIFINNNNKRKSIKVGDKSAAEDLASNLRIDLAEQKITKLNKFFTKKQLEIHMDKQKIHEDVITYIKEKYPIGVAASEISEQFHTTDTNNPWFDQTSYHVANILKSLYDNEKILTREKLNNVFFYKYKGKQKQEENVSIVGLTWALEEAVSQLQQKEKEIDNLLARVDDLQKRLNLEQERAECFHKQLAVKPLSPEAMKLYQMAQRRSK